MNVLQLIDSLDAGGAERMAVNIANKLSNVIETSHLCVTRKEGLLKDEIQPNIGYLFLQKKSTFDREAIKLLRTYIQQHKIDIVHAHSSSFFLATLMKFSNPELKLVWHDHYGNSDKLSSRPKLALQICSRFFNSIIAVNNTLTDWATKYLNCKHVNFLRNFIYRSELNIKDIDISGFDGKRLVCVANFRPQKDHLNLLKAFKMLQKNQPEVSLHLLGQINNDSCSQEIHSFISENDVQNVHIHGSVNNIPSYLQKCDIGILSSMSEGLPLSLLEYGLSGLPVICTDVGQCAEVVGNDGIIVSPQDSYQLFNAIENYLTNPDKRNSDAERFHQKIKKDYSEHTFIPELLSMYKR